MGSTKGLLDQGSARHTMAIRAGSPKPPRDHLLDGFFEAAQHRRPLLGDRLGTRDGWPGWLIHTARPPSASTGATSSDQEFPMCARSRTATPWAAVAIRNASWSGLLTPIRHDVWIAAR